MVAGVGLSPRQQSVLDFLRQYEFRHGYAAAIRDVQLGLDISTTSVVVYALDGLERLGYIERVRGQARSIRLVRIVRSRCPLCGCPGDHEL